MRGLLIAVSLLICASVGACAQDSDVATIEAVDDVVGRLDEAFEAQDAATIKSLMTPGHLAVTPFYSTPQSVDELLATLADYKIKQTELSEPTVTLLGPGSAMRTLTAKLEGTFADKPISENVFITAIVVKQGGKWRERLYQVTRLAP